MTRIYIAAPYSYRAKLAAVADALQADGHVITSRWIYPRPLGMTPRDFAEQDLADIDAADMVVSFTPDHPTPNNKGGRHAEFGYALSRGKRLILIGERENVFHHLPCIEIYASPKDWLATLKTTERR